MSAAVSPLTPGFEMLDHLASPVFVLAPDDQGVPRYLGFNVHARSYARRPLEDFIGRTALEVYPGAGGKTAFERHVEVLNSGMPMTYEIELPLAGKIRAVRTTLVPQKSADGTVAYLYGSSIDLTAEREIREAQVSFKTATREMEEFIAMAAHDLRSPMVNMSTIADLLLDEFEDRGDGKLELIEMIADVAQKSNALISDVLSHANAVETIDSRSRFNCAALCRDICDVLDPQNEHRFTYTSVDVSTDRTAMQIGIRNIIDNAIKYGNRDRLNIDITVQRSEGGMLNVIVSDDGEGFSEHALDFLNGGAFKPASGYGLLGVRRMVQARGGRMTAKNMDVGSGGVVCFTIPGEWIGLTNSLGDPLRAWDDMPLVDVAKSA